MIDPPDAGITERGSDGFGAMMVGKDVSRMENSVCVFFLFYFFLFFMLIPFQVNRKPRRLPNLIMPGCHRLFLSHLFQMGWFHPPLFSFHLCVCIFLSSLSLLLPPLHIQFLALNNLFLHGWTEIISRVTHRRFVFRN